MLLHTLKRFLHLSPRQCLHSTECGGCSFQHVPYEKQLEQKQEVVEKAFAPFPVERIIPCKTPWRYRNKMEFSFSQNKAGERYLGLILHKSRGKVFNLKECLISSPWFTATLHAVKKWWDQTELRAYHFRKGEGSLRTLTVRESKRTGQRMVMLTVSGDSRFSLSKAQIEGFIQAINDPKVSIFLRIQQCIKGSPTQFYEMHLSGPEHIEEELHLFGQTLTFKISPTSFFQPNTLQAEVLYTKALEMVPLHPNAHVFDLYAGTATIGMILALKAKQVTSIELNPHAVFDAQANAALNGIENITLHCGDVGKVLSEITLTPDLVVVDPPRTGLDLLALEHLSRLQPRHILYISCNPLTQAPNVTSLSGYQPIKIQPVDQFPHTPHIENIVLLERR